MGYTRTWSIVNGRQLVSVSGTPWVAPADLITHANDTTAVHGIANTAVLVTQDDLDAAIADFATEDFVTDAIADHVTALH